MKYLFTFLMLLFLQKERGTVTIWIRTDKGDPIKGTLHINGQTHHTNGTLNINTSFGLYDFEFKGKCQSFKGSFNLHKKMQAIVIFLNDCSM